MKHVSSYALAAALGCVIVMASAMAGALGLERLPAPFVWRDVGLVYFLSALPLAASLAALLGRSWPLDQKAALVVAAEMAVLVMVPWLYVRPACGTMPLAWLASSSNRGLERPRSWFVVCS